MVARKKKDCEGVLQTIVLKGGGGMHEGERGTTAGVRFLRDRLTDYPGMVSASSMHSS